jgi:restriction system protein
MANYEEHIRDPYTGEVALIKANERLVFIQRKEKKYETWAKRAERSEKQKTKENGINTANELTNNAKKEHNALISILEDTLCVNDKIQWENLKDTKKFKQFKSKLYEPVLYTYMEKVPKKSFFEVFSGAKKRNRERLEAEANNKFTEDFKKFEINRIQEKEKYESEKKKFLKVQLEHNTQIENLKLSFEQGDPVAIEKYAETVFSKSQYPESIELNYEVIYVEDRRTIIVNVDLPSPESIPKEIEFKYVQTRNEITSKEMKKADFQKLYDEIISQIALRTIHEVYESVYVDVVDFVVFNGYVDSIDKKTGNDFRACILSIQAEKEYFMGLNLKQVSSKDCISGLKGVLASEFINLAPVKPILNLNREDRRIIETDEIIDAFDTSKNLADMDWQKFEVLVRDLFSKEFSGDGVDVKVTQASRDAGVDAIIFDPDPIKGGKFVIQAKRYNNVVGVSAVRDLYGTVMNEGAVKGILVTTSTYGKDSIEFAKDKPLTLLSGAELVHMFNRHGYDVNIALRKK